MIHYKTEDEIGLMRLSSLLVGKTLAEVARSIAPGVKTKTLDNIAETYIRDNKAIPGFKNYHGYPATLCISINDQVVHGIPSDRIIRDGDVVSVDCGAVLNGFYGDSAYTFAVGNVSKENIDLMRVTKESLYKGIEMAVTGNRVGDIGFAVQNHVEKNGFSAVRDLVGHGLGRNLHEEPQIPNFGRRGSGIKLMTGLVICIEPMINRGKKNVIRENDGWTIRTSDGLPSAHYEHCVAVRKDKADVLSTFEYIEKIDNKNIIII